MAEPLPTGSADLTRRGFLNVAAIAAAGAASTAGGFMLRGVRGGATEATAEAPSSQSLHGAKLGIQRVVWSVETDEPLVALTFDDGPDPDLTPQILDILDRYDLQATFFVMGFNAERHRDLVTAAHSRGHEIGNHTWMHDDLTAQETDEAHESIALGDDAVLSAIGARPRYFRPPQGKVSNAALRYAGEHHNDVVLWSLSRGVRDVGRPQEVADHVLGKIGPGEILLLHDGVGREDLRGRSAEPGPRRARRDVEVRALPAIIERTLERGLRPVTLSELLAAERQTR